MRREKIFILIIVVLVITNIALLALFLSKDGKRDHAYKPDRMKSYLKKDVGFSDGQLASYDSLHAIHQQQNESNMKGSHEAMQAHLKILAASGFSDSAINVTLEEMSEERNEGIKTAFQHMREIRMLCTPEQLATFDATIHKMFKRPERKRKD